jgi:hypothetical protein
MADPKKQKAKRYGLSEKMDALAILRNNDFNFTKTSKEVGASIPSIRAWHNKYGKQMKEESEKVEAAMVESSTKIQEHKKDFMAEVYDTKLLIVKRVQDLIPSAKSIRILSDALAVLHSMELAEANPVGTILSGDSNRDFILNFVSNQLSIETTEGKIVRANKFINVNSEDHGKD